MAPAETFADRLKLARTNAGYRSAKSAAEAMGAKVQTYIAYENGTRRTSNQEKIRGMAEFFGVSPEWLLMGVESSPAARGAAGFPDATAAEERPAARRTGFSPVAEVMQVSNRGPGKALVRIEKVLPWDVALKIMELAERGTLTPADR